MNTQATELFLANPLFLILYFYRTITIIIKYKKKATYCFINSTVWADISETMQPKRSGVVNKMVYA